MHYIIDLILIVDTNLMYFLNGAIRNPVFSWLMPLFDHDRAWLVPMILAWLALMIFGDKRARIIGIGALILVGITDPLSSRVIKPFFERSRPCNVLPLLNMWKDGAWIVIPDPVLEVYRGSFSFTSSHATNTGAQALYWSFAFPRTKWLWSGLAVTVGLSRIYIGIHWPSDILGGWIVGGICFMIVWYGINSLVPGLSRDEDLTNNADKATKIVSSP